jgi:hypothetical protein
MTSPMAYRRGPDLEAKLAELTKKAVSRGHARPERTVGRQHDSRPAGPGRTEPRLVAEQTTTLSPVGAAGAPRAK